MRMMLASLCSVLTIYAAIPLVLGENPVSVYSANAVGCVRVSLAKGINLLSFPFNESGSKTQCLATALGSLPDGTRLRFFDAVTDQYSSYFSYGAIGGWTDESGNNANLVPVPRGRAFWIESPVATNVMFVGEVPAAPVTSVDILPGFQLMGMGYPTTNALNKTSGCDYGDMIYACPNDGSGKYVPYIYMKSLGWVDSKMKPAAFAGFDLTSGFWYISVAKTNKVWVQIRPYNWW